MSWRRKSWRAALVPGLVLVLVLIAAGACGGHQAPPGARLAIDGDSFDLGRVATGQSVRRTIEFRNTGVAPLEVSIVKVRPAPDAECGCGVESFEVAPKAVPPGDSGEMVFQLKVPEGMEGMTDTMLAQLESNDPTKPKLTITLIFEMGE
ncbi:MAG: DUF1573 domain-containing protein [Dehalococcoidia bacterium]|nr:DUF1573 domain-containing protein [Dehalococcoidia bacterium]